MKLSEEIKKDGYILGLYEQIKEREKDIGHCNHDMKHIIKVLDRTEKILSLLNETEETIEKARIAVLLHDIGCIEGKENHAENSYIMASEYLKNKGLSNVDKEEILKAIRNHSKIKYNCTLLEAVIILADKLDFDQERILPAGKKIIGMKQVENIKEIELYIDNSKNTINVNFNVESDFDEEEFQKYYFISKIFKTISEFASLINFEEKVTLNKINWEAYKLKHT